MKAVYLIGIDAGTQGTKAALYRADGALICAHTCPTRLLYHQDAVEQSPDELYQSVLDALRELLAQAAISPSEVACIGIDGQMAGILGVGPDGQAVTPYDSWLDNRCAPYIRLLKEEEKRIIQLTGGSVTNAHGPKLLWWMRERPSVWRKITSFVTLSGYLSMRLCGRREGYMDETHLHFTGFADQARRQWDEGLSHAFGNVRDKLPPILRCTEIIGALSGDAARACGLLPGTPVAAGCGDTAASALGAGIVGPGMALDVAGTASVLALSTKRYAPDPGGTLLYMRSVIEGLFTPLSYIAGGGLCIRWAKTLLGKGYEELEALAQNADPASDALVFLPHFTGRACPAGPGVPGAWWGLKWNWGPGEMYRSVLASIAAEYSGYHDILLQSAAISPGGVVRGTGGGAQSPLFCQMKADALGMDYQALAWKDTAPYGSAAVAGMAVKVYNETGTDLPVPAQAGAIFHPRPEALARYRATRRRMNALAKQAEKIDWE